MADGINLLLEDFKKHATLIADGVTAQNQITENRLVNPEILQEWSRKRLQTWIVLDIACICCVASWMAFGQ